MVKRIFGYLFIASGSVLASAVIFGSLLGTMPRIPGMFRLEMTAEDGGYIFGYLLTFMVAVQTGVGIILIGIRWINTKKS